VLPRPDSNGFTRFVISAGVFLVVAAFVVPGLVLRDTGVLTVSLALSDKRRPPTNMRKQRSPSFTVSSDLKPRKSAKSGSRPRSKTSRRGHLQPKRPESRLDDRNAGPVQRI
jgi:hypothetical protein